MVRDPLIRLNLTLTLAIWILDIFGSLCKSECLVKQKIPDLPLFKEKLVQAVIADWELRTDAVETQFKELIDSSSDIPNPNSPFSKKELVEQKAHIELSGLRTPLVELKKFSTIPLQENEKVGDFSIFDLTVTELHKSRTTTYFVLPLPSLEMQKNSISFNGVSVVLITRMDPLYGRTLNSVVKIEKFEKWDEPDKGHFVRTGKFSNETNSRVTWIYK